MDDTYQIRLDEHVDLDPLKPSDTAEVYLTIDSQRGHLGRWLPFVELTKEPAFTEDYVKKAVSAADTNHEPMFVIRHDGNFAGLAGFKNTDIPNRRTEIGYWISRDFEGLGMVSRSVAALLELAYSRLGMNRVQIKCAVGNTRSRNVPLRLGFSLEGIERDGELLAGGVFVDVEVFSLLKSDWERRNS